MYDEEVSPNSALWLTVALIVFVIIIFMIPLAIPTAGVEQEGVRATTVREAAPETTGEIQQPKPERTAVEIIIYGGEIEATKYGYGFNEDKLQSPGPEIRVKVGSTVRIVFKNIGNLPHTFAVTEERKFDAEPLWGVQLGSPTRPVGPRSEDSITFTPNRPGEYYYVCQVPGHIELGMWGKLIAEE